MRAVVLVGGFALWAFEASPDLRADANAVTLFDDLKMSVSNVNTILIELAAP